MEEEEIKQHLLEKSQEFRKAFDLHKTLEKKLVRFQSKSYLTEKDRWEEKQIKKNKLQLKDKMYRLMRDYRESVE